LIQNDTIEITSTKLIFCRNYSRKQNYAYARDDINLPKSLEEIYKHYEFNKTEPETLSGLIESVIKKSDEIKSNFKLYRQLVETIFQIFVRENFLQTIELSSSDELYKEICCLGVDGSFQCVGGLGGIWYVPISCSRIFLKNVSDKHPKVDITADIHDINEIEYPNLEKEASFRMLIGETKAVNEWLSKASFEKESVIFIDGPIVDPPWFSNDKRYTGYLHDRCNVIERCIDNNILLIGCVKRIAGKYLINHIANNLAKSADEKGRTKRFISDAHLISYIFTKASIESPSLVFYTSPINVSHTDETHEAYLKEGIDIYTIFMQKGFSGRPIRLDIAVPCDKEIDISKIAVKVVKISAIWTFPGQNWPLPVVLAHYKCNIRRGCAEVLYDEMITRTTSPKLFDNIVRLKWSEKA